MQIFSLASCLRKCFSLHMTQRIHAILTGDLIASTALPPAQADAAMAALRAATTPEHRFTRYRGDGWQILTDRPGSALRLALRLTAALTASGTALSTRIAIGFGPIDRAAAADLSAASGTAFIRSGRALDHMPRPRRWAISGGPTLPPWIAAAIPLAEWHSARWTQGQAAVAAEWLDRADRTQEEWAARMGLTRQAWKARFDGAGIAAWQPTLDMWEQWQGEGVTDD